MEKKYLGLLLSSKVFSSRTTVSPPTLKLIASQFLERSYFVLDTESDLVHFFKKTNQTKPYQTLSLYYGVVMNDMNNEQVIIDKANGKTETGFRF